MKLGKYCHYKTKALYEVIGTARHSETQEEMVIYKALYDSKKIGYHATWVRPKSMFLEQVNFGGSIMSRFQWIGTE